VLPPERVRELDEIIARANALIKDDYSEAMRILGTFQMPLERPAGLDPFGENYREWVRAVHAEVSQVGHYDAHRCEVDRNVATDLPLADFFPYSTRNADLIGSYLIGVGLIVRNLGLSTGSRVIEYGVGWGHVSAALARTGYRVTCVDIEPKFLKLAARQARAGGVEVTAFAGKFGTDPYEGRAKADGIVFFEAFHHSLSHQDLLGQLRRILRPGGRLILCGEPISPTFPLPWGIRTDGHALWAIRSFGWMELGFNEDYFLRLMVQNGFSVEKVQYPELGTLGLLYRCTLHAGDFHLGESLLPSEEAASWASQEKCCRFSQAASWLTLDSGMEWRSIIVHVANHMPVPISATFYCGLGRVQHRFAPGERREIRLPLLPSHRQLHIGSETRVPAQIGAGTNSRSLGIAVERIIYHR
jgi:2-polyprenyl-3-methyl-5-hydroxy-6-metoxy-1,4-benzoquinol methylase